MFEKEKIYIAGPECFYSDGVIRLAVMKQLAISGRENLKTSSKKLQMT